MPNSGQKAAARTRATYTGERVEAAFAGVGRSGGLGLDECTDSQAEMRAWLVLGLMNQGAIEAAPGAWALARITTYSITVSPRWNRLVLITDVPDNVARSLVPSVPGETGMPGLEITGYSEYRSSSVYVFHHHPTGADIELTPRLIPHPADSRVQSALPEPRAASVENPRADIPEMTSDARKLLAGLAVRFALRQPRLAYDVWGSPSRLWGSGDDWELVWHGHPSLVDLTVALTDEVAGIPGAVAVRHRKAVEIRMGSATLELRRWEA
jgi:hypothetical protein